MVCEPKFFTIWLFKEKFAPYNSLFFVGLPVPPTPRKPIVPPTPEMTTHSLWGFQQAFRWEIIPFPVLCFLLSTSSSFYFIFRADSFTLCFIHIILIQFAYL